MNSGVLDTPTVTLAVLIATVINTAGDVYFVCNKGLGVLGAAIATSFATIVSNLFLIQKGLLLMKKWRLAFWVEKWGEDRGLPADGDVSIESFREFLVLPSFSLPDRESLQSLVLLAGPIFLIMIAKLVEFWCMTTGANNFGLLSTACHNLLMRIFLFFAVFGDGVSQASQTFLPGLLVKRKKAKRNRQKELSKEAGGVIQRLTAISAALGLFICVLSCFIANNAGGMFTTDTELKSLLSTSSTFMGLNLLLNPLAEVLEGVIIASGETRYLLISRGIILSLFLCVIKWNVSRFTDIWKTLLVFQLIKILLGARFCSRHEMKI